MATDGFPKVQNWKVVATDEVFKGSSFTIPENQRARYCRLFCYNLGISSGRFRVSLYSDSDLTKVYAHSNWLTVAEIQAAFGSSFGSAWRGLVTFEWPSPLPRLEPGSTYHLAVEADSYTRNGSTAYWAFVLDWPFEINSGGSSNQALGFELYSYRRVRF